MTAARPAKSAPVRANSSGSQPTPTPSRSRPPLSACRVAACLASRTGSCSGRMRTEVPSRTRSVTRRHVRQRGQAVEDLAERVEQLPRHHEVLRGPHRGEAQLLRGPRQGHGRLAGQVPAEVRQRQTELHRRPPAAGRAARADASDPRRRLGRARGCSQWPFDRACPGFEGLGNGPVTSAHDHATADCPMSGGLVALLDDVAALAKLAAASVDDVGAAAGRASAKAAGVVVDDTAVTPRYVHGFTADRELPMIKRIALGSLRNKLLIILPAILLLSQFLPWLLTPILMIGGIYLCFEGAEKIYEKVSGHHAEQGAPAAPGPDQEKRHGQGRHPHRLHPLRRDHGHLAQRGGRRSLVSRAVILVVVAIGITAAGVRRRRADREDGRRRPAPVRAQLRSGPADRSAAGRGDAQAVGPAVHRRGGGDALGRGAHPAGRADDLGWHAPYALVHARGGCRRRRPVGGGSPGW